MREHYIIGQGARPISLEVKIGTPGLAHTWVYLFSDETTFEKIAESGDDDANIAKMPIGTADELRGKFLKIRTSVDFRLMDPEQWPQLIETIFCEYILSGGPEGEQVFRCQADDKSINGEANIVIIDKIIDLIQSPPA